MSRPPRSLDGPAIARALLGALLPSDHVADVIGDLEERYRGRFRTSGRVAARAWYWRQTLQFVVGVRGAARSATTLTRSPHRTNLMRDLVYDLRHAARGLLREPGFTVVAVLTLGLGVGANTAIFSVIDSLILRPLDYPQSERLFRLYHYDDRKPAEHNFVTAPDYVDYRQGVAAFEQLAGMYSYHETGFDLEPVGGGPGRRLRSLQISSNYFDTYGVRPAIGRTLTVAEESGESQVAIVSHRLWREVFGPARDAVGETLMLSGSAWEVVGVMPQGFSDPIAGDVDIWVPESLTPGGFNNRDNYYLTVVGRLAEGATVHAAQSELDALALEIAESYPESSEHKRSRIVPLQRDLLGGAAATLWTLMGASTFVLLIACANVANLQIGRSVSRRKELAVRSALGSGRSRLLRQLTTEGLLVSLLGGACGWALALIATRSLLRLAPEQLMRINEVRFDARVFAFAMLAALATTVLFGVGPALRSLRGNLEASLREGGRGGSSGTGQSRLRSSLVVAEVALAMTLLVAAGLLLRSVALLQARDLGITNDPVLTFELRVPGARYPSAAERTFLYEQIQSRIAALPGVVASGATHWLPATGSAYIWGYAIEDPSAEDGVRWSNANVRVVAGDYFEAAGIELVAGRLFDDRDVFESPGVTVVSQQLADESFPGESPVGRSFRIAGTDVTIVGLVSDVTTGPRTEPYRTVHFPHAQRADRNWAMFQMVRTERPADGLMAAVRAEIGGIDPSLVAFNARPLADAIGGAEARTRFAMTLLTLFAGVAALLAGIGIYGVLAFAVGRRRREIGIRMALGARAARVQADVVRHGLGLVVVGIAIGGGLAIVTGRLLSALLFGTTPGDPLVLALVATVIAAVAVLAAWVPARRASRVAPVGALRG